MLIDVEKYPELRMLCWNRPAGLPLEEVEALALYERNWRFVDTKNLEPDETSLIDHLIAQHGEGVSLGK